MKYILCLCLTFFFGVELLNAQGRQSVSGFVFDGASGEVLIGATLFDPLSRLGTTTNEYGFFSIYLPASDSLHLFVSFLGYEQQILRISDISKCPCNIQLMPGVSLSEVMVIANGRDNVVHRNESGVVRLPMREVALMPNLFGEVDIIKAYQLTPGVQSGGEGRSDLYVRGGSPDQNLVLLDDVPLYHISHFGGFFSIFNADAINDVKLVKGGFPARYGSRLSSVLDVRMKEGNMQKLSGSGTVGLLSSKVSVEAPIVRNKASFIISARKNVLPFFKLMDSGLEYHFYDLNAKLNWHISPKDRLFLSFYMGDDMLIAKNNTSESQYSNSIKWGNLLYSLRWNRVYGSKLFSNLTVYSTTYRHKTGFENVLKSSTLIRSYKNTLVTGVSDLSLKLNLDYIINPNVRFRLGVHAIHHDFFPNDETTTYSGIDKSNTRDNSSSRITAYENAAYIENEYAFSWVKLNLGFRQPHYKIGDVSYSSAEPRGLISFILREDLSMKYAYSRMGQYVHLLSYSGTGMPSDYWMPTTRNVKPETATEHSITLAKTFAEGTYELSIEAYRKTLQNLIAFSAGKSLIGNYDDWEAAIEMNGTGENSGIEFFLQKRTGETTGWAGITLSKAERHFQKLNNNRPFPFKYDRRVDLSLVANHQLSSKVHLSATWTYGSGYPVTLAEGYYNIDGEDVFIYGDINSYRMRDFHRLDASVNFPKKTRWGERTWSISAFNMYNRANPYFYFYSRTTITVPRGDAPQELPRGEEGPLALYQRSLFSFFPSFSYSFKF